MHQEYTALDDFLFRFDRGAFWMARHGLQLFYGAPAAFSSSPSLALRCTYAWLCTTRQLYRMLHSVGNELLARTYVIQDFIMPSKQAACELARRTNMPDVAIWPLWLCPVRVVSPRHPADASFGVPIQAAQVAGSR
mmetsp:Transcript_64830/g.107783  ORF Transcript_64830/g.107783 Transcript_64830/m.107783 type:complete len:136 (-) Transcript_64830:40-447(-)